MSYNFSEDTDKLSQAIEAFAQLVTKVESLEPDEKRFSNDDRERLHRKLEALLNSVEYQFKHSKLGTPKDDWGWGIDPHWGHFNSTLPREIVFRGLNLIAEIFGSEILNRALPTYGKSTVDVTYRLAKILEAMRPLFDQMGNQNFPLDAVIQDLEYMRSGDVPRIVKPVPRKRGQSTEPQRFARARFNALLIDSFLESRNTKPETRHNRIAKAFGERWGTIRKWRVLIESVIDPNEVLWTLDAAKQSWFWPHDFIGSSAQTKRYGSRYRRLLEKTRSGR